MASALKLTAMAKAAGCAAKLNPAILESVLRKLPRQTNPNVLVGFETNDDAGVYFVNDDLALVQTVDFFTPIVDDPFLFGQIAAANALSDVYAMGGRPISSLSLVGFPENADPAILEQIVRGGLSKMNEAECSVLGGHSIRTDDMLFGYAVTGTVHPKKIWRNVGARPGDVLIFTKPIGTGVITTALKKSQASSESLEAAVRAMTTLNGAAAAGFAELANLSTNSLPPIHAVTDVTGFGVLGHAREMALGDALGDKGNGIEPTSFEIDHAAFAYFQGAIEAARNGQLSGGLKNNRAFVAECAEFSENVAQEFRDLLFDPQTSGGLLAAIAPDFTTQCIQALARHGVEGRQIGRVIPKRSPLIFVK
ncbi:MAG TPA: selenide, water dikinase SelD [Candidatus Acidoferrum sp.]|nr:selenide, water dikinase SelD [Candidatus Acidoferrum sp.]